MTTMKTLSTRCSVTLLVVSCVAAPSLSPLRGATLAQSHNGKHKPAAHHASGPLLVRVAGAQLAEAKKALGKELPESANMPEGDTMFSGSACGCDKINIFANEKGKIISVSAYFTHELTWQEALKKVGLSDKGVTAKASAMPPLPDLTRTETTLMGVPGVKPGFRAYFYTEVRSAGENTYKFVIEK